MSSTFDWQSYQPTDNTYTGKTILVTGAADGIGRAITLALAKHGCTVLMLDKKARHLEKLYDQIISAGHTEPVIVPIDLKELTAESATVLANSILQDFGKLDGLLHNAAELGSPSPMDQYDMSHWDEVMQVNMHAPYLLTRALLPLLKQEITTHIVFSSAEQGRAPSAYWGAYSIAYAGIEAQMKLWAEELENISNIKVNSIDPGPVRTALRRRSHPGEDQGSLITPQAIANAYLYLFANHTGHGEQFICQ